MLERGVGARAAEHPGQLGDAVVALDGVHPAAGDVPVVGALDDEVPVGVRRHLGQVGDDDDLRVPGEGGQPRPDVEGGATADAGVDLVEDERRGRPWCRWRSRPRWRA